MEEATNWTESVEDLVHGGDVDKAISLLESVVSKLESFNLSHSDLQLSSALFDLSKLYNSKGFSLKADEAQSRALLIRQRSHQTLSLQGDLKIAKKELDEDGIVANSASTYNGSSDDDWEAIADRAPDELLSPECLPGVSKLSLEETKVQSPKRRGRGTFSNRKHGLYSDEQSGGSIIDDPENEDVCHSSEGDTEIRKLKYGTRHVLVLADFPPRTGTTDLEKLLENFKDHGVVIRCVNDTTALAVFRTPSIALEACNCIQCPFTVRVLDENDILLSSISTRDLEPPLQRPETSAGTAKRLIAHGMGIKLPSTTSGSRELRKQEEARRNRIVSRQNMRDDAWGDDVN
uniref:Coiled-coil domain-containing protein R3HCC1L n=1 Tax=Davidia involucrata TaxID=16924 RepID=A0A5B6YSI6_DAVIN